MGDGSGIEWTDATWNPLTGCEYASPGCLNCYAARQAAGRLKNQPAYAGLAVKPEGKPAEFTGEIRLLPERLDQPIRWRRPRRIFVNSMSDLFHPDVPDDFVRAVFWTMAEAPQHQFQVLTKRPQRMAKLLVSYDFWASVWESRSGETPCDLPNVWLGTSIESDRYAFRADHVRATPAAVRWLSLEPLLGPLPSLNLEGIDWVVVGGESGPGARPIHPEWVREIRDRCIAAGVAFHFKQWGEWHPGGDPGERGTTVVDGTVRMARVGKKAAGRVLDGRTWDEYPD